MFSGLTLCIPVNKGPNRLNLTPSVSDLAARPRHSGPIFECSGISWSRLMKWVVDVLPSQDFRWSYRLALNPPVPQQEPAEAPALLDLVKHRLRRLHPQGVSGLEVRLSSTRTPVSIPSWQREAAPADHRAVVAQRAGMVVTAADLSESPACGPF